MLLFGHFYVFMLNAIIKGKNLNKAKVTENMPTYSEADLGLLQHPGWSAL